MSVIRTRWLTEILQMVNENWEERPTTFNILTSLLESLPTEANLLELIKLMKSKLAKNMKLYN